MRRIVRSAAPRGMTLIEIMIVLVILGMIASLVTWSLWGEKQEADKRLASLNMHNLKQAVLSYRLKTNALPESLDELEGREIERVRADPWGSP